MMIEKYFKKGARFNWNKPNDTIGAVDGSLCDSKGARTALAYDGVDPEIYDSITNISTHGYFSNGLKVDCDWLDYAPGRTAVKPVGGYDVLTGFMSGCLLGYYMNKGVKTAVHVGTIDAEGARGPRNRKVKQTFAASMPQGATGFSPASAWSMGEINAIAGKSAGKYDPKIFGLITALGAFYSIVMFRTGTTSATGQSQWCVGGIKPVPPLNTVRFKAALLQ